MVVLPEAVCFSFAFACIPLQRGITKANEKKSNLCALGVSAVKKLLLIGQRICG
jgi:hypothetical protein